MVVLSMIRDYASNSTAHGLPKLAKARSARGKVFWTLICFSALCFLLILGTSLLRKYYAYPKSVRLELANQPIPFPAVSLCNLRPVDVYTIWKAIFNESGERQWDIGEDFDYDGRDPPDADTSIFESHLIRFANNFKSYQSYSDIKSEKDPIKLWKMERELLSRMTMIGNLNLTAAQQGGVQKEQFIAKCEYGGEHCTAKNFSLFQDPAYLNCYTFNLSKNLDSIYEGPDNGLSVVLFVPGPSIMGQDMDKAADIALHQELSLGGEGVRVVIHEQNTVPYPLTEGLDIPRGVSASVAIKLIENDRLGPPHGNCTDKKTIDGFIKYSYTMASCKKTCLQKLVMETCNCGDVSLPIWNTNLTLCTKFDELPAECQGRENITRNIAHCEVLFDEWFQRVGCTKSTKANISKNLSAWTECDCMPRCHDTEYSLFYSLSDWPMQEQQRDVVQELLYVDRFIHNFPPEKQKQYFGSIDVRNSSPTYDDYRTFVEQKNLIRLNIYISDTSVVKIMETEAYSLTHLASDIGGQLSLWIGVSIITMVEIIELIWGMIKICAAGTNKTKEEEKVNGTDMEKQKMNYGDEV
nr:FMRFamide-gated sodium channel-like 3 [Malacoceros fuliginosus]